MASHATAFEKRGTTMSPRFIQTNQSPFYSAVEDETAEPVTKYTMNFGLPIFQEPDSSDESKIIRKITYIDIEDDEEEQPPKRERNRDAGAESKAEKKTSDKLARKESQKPDAKKDGFEQPAEPTRRRRTMKTEPEDDVTAPLGSTRLAAKRARRRDRREVSSRRRGTITEVEYIARRENVKREMLVREHDGLNQIAVLEDDVLVEHYVARRTQISMVGNVYLGRVQNVLPSMEAAFVDIGKGRNAVLYAGEVNWEEAGITHKNPRIEQALKTGDPVLVQVTKDPIGHKGARLTAQITLAGRHLVLVPGGNITGISRKLPEAERHRLKKILKEILPEEHGVIVRTAAEGATQEQLNDDIERLVKSWKEIQRKSKQAKTAPVVLKSEPELAVRVVRDIFNEDFDKLKVQGKDTWETISEYVSELSPELHERLEHWESSEDIFEKYRVDEQLAKAFDRKVWLPSGGTLVIDRTEAMTVIDINTGKYTGSGGSLEETVTLNNLEAAEEIVRQLRLRDIGGIIVIDFIDMVLEANRDLVLRRLIECLGRDRTRHQVAEVTSLGLVQMTRKRVGQGLVEAFSVPCEACDARGYIIQSTPVEKGEEPVQETGTKKRRHRRAEKNSVKQDADKAAKREAASNAMNSIAAATHVDVPPAGKKDVEKDTQSEESTKRSEDTGQRTSSEETAPRRRRRRVVVSSGVVTPKRQDHSEEEAQHVETSSPTSGVHAGTHSVKTRSRGVVSSGTISTSPAHEPVSVVTISHDGEDS
ncbi:Rne/Rng family ribonuclease [Actinotignum urinale]|nr:Rne/Rng family ribonuclease [Actinotignum urinale]MDY5151829.1 Rne/Rng family ribonuclease [Actinotignum urinale]WIK58823.1 Rne/Rng family ribonuclease [Actinotignum urinale]